mmetsp:Transcript_21222/g.39613  ORF Transcript_21222/g.39613 Transcript_21222/m.39613 type:complete len:82 (+) Transcript_21222:84-329(+)
MVVELNNTTRRSCLIVSCGLQVVTSASAFGQRLTFTLSRGLTSSHVLQVYSSCPGHALQSFNCNCAKSKLKEFTSQPPPFY